MTLITFQDGKPLFRDGKVGTEQACCCGEQGCDCCGDDFFSFSELVTTGECAYIRGHNVILEAGGGAFLTFQQWLSTYGITKKDGTPDRECIENARVYTRLSYQYDASDIPCAGASEIRIYIPDCQSGGLADITADYDAPEGFLDREVAGNPCPCVGELLPMPRMPICNPLP